MFFRLRLLHTNGIGFSGNENIKFEIFDKCTSNVCGRCNRQGLAGRETTKLPMKIYMDL